MTTGGNNKGLRNFDLTVDEIKILRSINQLQSTLDNLQATDPRSPRVEFLQREISALEEKLEDIRDNTLIR
jgi:hypothetical protein